MLFYYACVKFKRRVQALDDLHSASTITVPEFSLQLFGFPEKATTPMMVKAHVCERPPNRSRPRRSAAGLATCRCRCPAFAAQSVDVGDALAELRASNDKQQAVFAAQKADVGELALTLQGTLEAVVDGLSGFGTRQHLSLSCPGPPRPKCLCLNRGPRQQERCS